MSHYIDIRLRPDPEFLPHQLMDALFAKLHRQLVMLRSNDVGISFPQAGTVMQGLGPVMRLHAPSERLWQLQPGVWLDGMREMVMLGEVQEVPADAGQYPQAMDSSVPGYQRWRPCHRRAHIQTL